MPADPFTFRNTKTTRNAMLRRCSMAAAIAMAAAATSLVPAEARAAGALWGPDYFPDVSLTTQDGKTVRFYDDLLKDKIVAVDLIYTHCKYSCPLETARLAQVQRLLGDRVGRDIFFYSITLDPERDTPEVLKAYAEKFHARDGWTFLTGRKEDIKLIAHKLGLLSDDPTPVNRDGHTPELMVGNVPTGQWMRNSAVDNARFLATTIGGMLDGWKSQKPTQSYAHATTLQMTKGSYLFSTRCSACHTIGRGDAVGPDLLGVATSRDRAWLTRFIQMPDKVLAEGDPTARALYARYKEVNMPNLRLGPEDVANIIDHLVAETKARTLDPTAAGSSAVPGASAAGRIAASR
jgi:protein SCO1